MFGDNSAPCRLGGVSATLPHQRETRWCQHLLIRSPSQRYSALKFRCNCSSAFNLFSLIGFLRSGTCRAMIFFNAHFLVLLTIRMSIKDGPLGERWGNNLSLQVLTKGWSNVKVIIIFPVFFFMTVSLGSWKHELQMPALIFRSFY